jgi:hypothetical protein
VLTVAPSPNTSRPSFFDISGRAKWDAWALASKTYEGRPSEAEQRYLDIAKSLGWEDGATAAAAAAATDETEEQAESSGGGTGMGVSVSVVSPPSPDEEATSGLHGYAMGDDVAATSAFLRDNEDLDINARDEYVSLTSWRYARSGVGFFYTCPSGIHCAALGRRSREHRHS